MKTSISIAPPNSLILVMDTMGGRIPETLGDGIVSSTESCIAVGTLSSIDGETTITLTSHAIEQGDLFLAFSGRLSSPSKQISVFDIEDVAYLSMSISEPNVNVSVYVNDPTEPDNIIVVVGSRN